MNKLLAALGLIVVIGAGAFMLSGSAKEDVKEVSFGENPRVEVVSGGVALRLQAGSTTPLVTGDSLSVPSTIETGATGTAIIYFPDGSQARLDPSSSLTVAEGSYEEKTSSLKVRLSLSAGRVWSKVVDLATPESRWQVETAHTVATVRGTAFGVEANAKRSAILGAQHKIAVAPKDKTTGQALKDREIIVDENQYVEVDTESKGDPVVKQAEKKADVTAWADRNKQEDATIDRVLERSDIPREEIRRELLDGVIKRLEIRADLSGEGNAAVPDSSSVSAVKDSAAAPTSLNKTEVVSSVTPLRDAAPKPVAPKQTTTVSGETVATGEPGIKELVIVPERKVVSLEEEEVLSLKAFVVRTDGTRVEATSRVVWRVIGEIGVMKAPGLFVAKLSDQVSELGAAKGVVAATIKDTKTGDEFLDKTEIFEVRAKVVDESELQG